MILLFAALWILCPVPTPPVHAQQSAPNQEPARVPAPYMTYRGAAWLERPEREKEERPAEVLDVMGLKPGDVVADIGCGTGYYARKIAPLVAPGGKVYGVDIQPEMLDLLMEYVERDGVSGVEPVLGEYDDPKLPKGEIDWMILADVYHEFSEPEAMLARMLESLAPGGRIALLEYRIEDGTGDHIKPDHRMSIRQVLSEWKAAGFELGELHQFLPGQHLFIFRAAGSDGAIEDYDLLAALQENLVEIEAAGSGPDAVMVKIKRGVDRPIVITAPAGTYFESTGEAGDMIARRDAAILLFEDGWKQWTVRALRRHREKPVAQADSTFEVQSAANRPSLRNLVYFLQAGGHPFFAGPQTLEVEQAALWIATEDASYAELESHVQGGRVPREYAVAWAIVFCDGADIDVTTRRVWSDAERIFGNVPRDANLQGWYERMLSQ